MIHGSAAPTRARIRLGWSHCIFGRTGITGDVLLWFRGEEIRSYHPACGNRHTDQKRFPDRLLCLHDAASARKSGCQIPIAARTPSYLVAQAENNLGHSHRQNAGCSSGETAIDPQRAGACQAYTHGSSSSHVATSSPRSPVTLPQLEHWACRPPHCAITARRARRRGYDRGELSAGF